MGVKPDSYVVGTLNFCREFTNILQTESINMHKSLGHKSDNRVLSKSSICIKLLLTSEQWEKRVKTEAPFFFRSGSSY